MASTNDYILLQDFLREFFNYADSYTVAIESAKQEIAQDKLYSENWLRISMLIRDRKLLPGQPLALIHFDANQVLDENTDEEAYIWLDLMIYNIERDDKKVEKH